MCQTCVDYTPYKYYLIFTTYKLGCFCSRILTHTPSTPSHLSRFCHFLHGFFLHVVLNHGVHTLNLESKYKYIYFMYSNLLLF